MNNQKGQIILILILVMTVTLAIGLAIVQRSLVDVSTASRVEQSSRAFAAAEAGIETALQSTTPLTSSNYPQLTNESTVSDVQDTGLVPPPASSGNRQDALILPFLAKEDIAQIWLASYTSSFNPPPAAYTQSSLDVYWGNSTTDRAALELTLVYWDGSKYAFSKWYLDQIDRGNGFEVVSDCGGHTVVVNNVQYNYQCKKTLTSLPSGLMLLRVRLLYHSASQPLAVQAVGTCGSACSLPAQSRWIVATGRSGETQRRVQLFQLNNVIPPYFDYAIFSAGEISK